MKLIKSILKAVLKFLLILTAAAGLFFALGVLGKRLWAVTQIATVFFSMALPFSNHGTDQQVNRTALLNWLKNYEGLLPEKE